MNAPEKVRYKVLDDIVATVGKVLLGKEHQIRLSLACLLARGHLLLEDLPGMGKTTLAQGLARALGLDFNRIQFTSDLLPTDILGLSVYDKQTQQFKFHPGPVFCDLLLADEINRSTPKTQSALLEAMAEGQVTIEGETRQLPATFFVIATQNPVSQAGTFPLPESQQDRFMMCLSLGYPDAEAERTLLKGGDARLHPEDINPCIQPSQISELQAAASNVHAADPVIDYLQRLADFTRTSADFEAGLSPRAVLAILQCSKAWALLNGRNYVVPEDVQSVFPAAAIHRLRGAQGIKSGGLVQVERALTSVDVLS